MQSLDNNMEGNVDLYGNDIHGLRLVFKMMNEIDCK
jgi:hypothetical protein